MGERFETVSRPAAPEEILARLSAPVRGWFEGKFAGLTPPQRLAIPAIQAGRHTLVCAPTGSGKTLCAFLTSLSELFAELEGGRLVEGIHTVYISPLRALGTDIARNLTVPLTEIAAGLGHAEMPIRVAQRTGDSTPAERARLGKRPPHILVTTPETLALCLAQESMRRHLAGVRTIIIDELHSLAASKRGTDLALSVERLSTLATEGGRGRPQRIGLSATIAPLELMAEFLVGAAEERGCVLADASFDRPLELEVRAPFGGTAFATAAATSRRVFDMLEELIRAGKTTLVFTNTRAATERVSFALRKRFADDPEQIQAHHSSLDRELRRSIEARLKAGELRCVVCSTSLELGIDIGAIDRVVLLNSPKGISRGLQRVGRSGHACGGVARGTFIPTVPADLLEALVTSHLMRRRRLDAIRVPRGCLDVLAQHLIGMAVQAYPEAVELERAYALARRTLPFAELARSDFDAVIGYLIGEGAAASAAKLEVTGATAEGLPAAVRLARKGLAGLYYQNVGTITAEGHVGVRLLRNATDPEGTALGSVEEGFAAILKPGDRFVLSGRCVQFVRAKAMTVLVAGSDGQCPTVPRWYSGAMAMAEGLAEEIRAFRARVRGIVPAGAGAVARMLGRQFQASPEVAGLVAEFFCAQYRYADIPTEECLLIERVPDEEAVALVFHTMIGRAANEALARLVAGRMHRYFGGNSTVVVDDYAFGVWVGNTSAARRADRSLVRCLLSPERFEADLAEAVAASELFKSQFRATALRAHAIVQNRFSGRKFIGQLQGQAIRLHEALRQQAPEHMLIRETRRTVLEDILCAGRARAFLEQQTKLGLRILDLPAPSPFAFGLFATSRRDTLQLADTADFLLAMYQKVQRYLEAGQPAVPDPQGALF